MQRTWKTVLPSSHKWKGLSIWNCKCLAIYLSIMLSILEIEYPFHGKSYIVKK